MDVAHKKKGVKAGIVNAGMPLPTLSVQDAVNENLIVPTFIGDKKEILKCAEQIKWDISSFEKFLLRLTLSIQLKIDLYMNLDLLWVLYLFSYKLKPKSMLVAPL